MTNLVCLANDVVLSFIFLEFMQLTRFCGLAQIHYITCKNNKKNSNKQELGDFIGVVSTMPVLAVFDSVRFAFYELSVLRLLVVIGWCSLRCVVPLCLRASSGARADAGKIVVVLSVHAFFAFKAVCLGI